MFNDAHLYARSFCPAQAIADDRERKQSLRENLSGRTSYIGGEEIIVDSEERLARNCILTISLPLVFKGRYTSAISLYDPFQF